MQSNMFTLALALVSYSIQFLRIVYWSRKLSAKKKAGGFNAIPDSREP